MSVHTCLNSCLISKNTRFYALDKHFLLHKAKNHTKLTYQCIKIYGNVAEGDYEIP